MSRVGVGPDMQNHVAWGRALRAFLCCLFLAGCGGSYRQEPAFAATPSEEPVAQSPAATEAVAQKRAADPAMDAQPEPVDDGALQGSATDGDVLPTGIEPRSEGAAPVPRKRMLEIEAHLNIEVSDVKVAARTLRDLVEHEGGTITRDNLDSEGGNQRATFTFRIPSTDVDTVFPELERLGVLHSKNVQARDVSKEYFDVELRLHNLRLAMERYAALYQQTSDVDELLRIENELTRLRGEVEQLEGTLRYLRDRVAQATVNVTLWAPGSINPDVIHPEASFYPGVRAGWLRDFGSQQPGVGYASLGLSARFAQRGSIDLDMLRTLDGSDPTIEGFLLTVGGDTYSQFLGNGSRSYLNPYLGFRLGYGHRAAADEFLAGVTAGVELLKTEMISLELDLRAVGAFSDALGSRAVLQPTVGANVAF